MTRVIDIQEFREEGIAIVTDTEGKYVVSAHTDKLEVIPEVKHPFIPRNPCALVQPRVRMMT
jgi:hypothetical protein